MSERPSPELQALAAELFAAARAERPGPALGRRLALIDPRQTRQQAARIDSALDSASDAAPAARRRQGRLARAVVWAALAAGSVGLWWVAQAGDAVLISAERTPERAHAPRASQQLTAPSPALPPAPVAASVPPSAAVRLSEPLAPSPVAAEPAAAVRAPAHSSQGRDAHAPSRAREPRAAAPRAERRASTTDVAPITHESPPSSSGSNAAAGVSLARTPAAAPPPSAPPASLRRELELLEQARAALRTGDPRQALDRLETHARERSSGALVAEATLLRIEALAALGERSAASDLARRFVNDNPHSALSDRARSFIDAVETAAP